MNYKQFDSLEEKGSTRERVITLLQDSPMTIEELANTLKIHRTSMFYHLKDERIIGKKFGKKIYYGLKERKKNKSRETLGK